MINNSQADAALPLVSFVIPTHNRAHILEECLESVVNQTYKNIEVVLVNDNSEDNTEEILKKYCGSYSFFKYYNSEGIGGNAARNLGIQKANGEYIAFMDDDDICELFRIEEQMKIILDTNYKYDFIVSGFYTFNQNREKVEVINYLKPLDSIGFTVRWLIKKDIVLKAGGFDINQPALQDVEFFWRLKNISKIYFSPKCVVKVRISSISITQSRQKMIDGIKRLISIHGSKMSKFERNYWITALCRQYAYEKDWKNFKDSINLYNLSGRPVLVLILLLSYHLRTVVLLKIYSRFIAKGFKFIGTAKKNYFISKLNTAGEI